MPTKYDQRPEVTPPHVSLRVLRQTNKLTLDQVVDLVNDYLGESTKPFTRGALSAIENGHRGASARIVEALEVAYGLGTGDVVTDYEPRIRKGSAA